MIQKHGTVKISEREVILTNFTFDNEPSFKTCSIKGLEWARKRIDDELALVREKENPSSAR